VYTPKPKPNGYTQETKVLPIIPRTEQSGNSFETDYFLQKAGLKTISYDLDSFASNSTK
jgi:hypothetical protein